MSDGISILQTRRGGGIKKLIALSLLMLMSCGENKDVLNTRDQTNNTTKETDLNSSDPQEVLSDEELDKLELELAKKAPDLVMKSSSKKLGSHFTVEMWLDSKNKPSKSTIKFKAPRQEEVVVLSATPKLMKTTHNYLTQVLKKNFSDKTKFSLDLPPSSLVHLPFNLSERDLRAMLPGLVNMNKKASVEMADSLIGLISAKDLKVEHQMPGNRSLKNCCESELWSHLLSVSTEIILFIANIKWWVPFLVPPTTLEAKTAIAASWAAIGALEIMLLYNTDATYDAEEYGQMGLDKLDLSWTINRSPVYYGSMMHDEISELNAQSEVAREAYFVYLAAKVFVMIPAGAAISRLKKLSDLKSGDFWKAVLKGVTKKEWAELATGVGTFGYLGLVGHPQLWACIFDYVAPFHGAGLSYWGVSTPQTGKVHDLQIQANLLEERDLNNIEVIIDPGNIGTAEYREVSTPGVKHPFVRIAVGANSNYSQVSRVEYYQERDPWSVDFRLDKATSLPGKGHFYRFLRQDETVRFQLGGETASYLDSWTLPQLLKYEVDRVDLLVGALGTDIVIENCANRDPEPEMCKENPPRNDRGDPLCCTEQMRKDHAWSPLQRAPNPLSFVFNLKARSPADLIEPPPRNRYKIISSQPSFKKGEPMGFFLTVERTGYKEDPCAEYLSLSDKELEDRGCKKLSEPGGGGTSDDAAGGGTGAGAAVP